MKKIGTQIKTQKQIIKEIIKLTNVKDKSFNF